MTQSPDAETFTVEELTDRAQQWLGDRGLDAHYYRRVQDAPSERTIRYYRTHGLLDEPVRVGKERRYTRRHMLQLVAIKALQTKGFSHARIQAELYGRTDAELEAVVAAVTPPAGPEADAPVAVLHEVALAPGLRVTADPAALSRLSDDDRAALVARFEAALHRLAGRAPRPAEPHRSEGGPSDDELPR